MNKSQELVVTSSLFREVYMNSFQFIKIVKDLLDTNSLLSRSSCSRSCRALHFFCLWMNSRTSFSSFYLCQDAWLLQYCKEQPRQSEIGGGCNLDAKPSVLHQVASIHRNGKRWTVWILMARRNALRRNWRIDAFNVTKAGNKWTDLAEVSMNDAVLSLERWSWRRIFHVLASLLIGSECACLFVWCWI